MKVILTKDVAGTGRSGQVIEVSDGHARNFLIPRHLALPATVSALARVQKEEQEHQAKVLREQEKFALLKSKLENKTFVVKAKAEKTHLFAAIRKEQIVVAIKNKLDVDIESNQIVIEKPIKSLGLSEVEIRFANHGAIKVKLNVESI